MVVGGKVFSLQADLMISDNNSCLVSELEHLCSDGRVCWIWHAAKFPVRLRVNRLDVCFPVQLDAAGFVDLFKVTLSASYSR